MLSDRDRETLNEMQRRLTTEDPQFAGSFDLTARRLAVRRPGPPRASMTILIVIALLLTALMIVVHAASPAVFFTAAACYLIWLRRGRHARDGHQSS